MEFWSHREYTQLLLALFARICVFCGSTNARGSPSMNNDVVKMRVISDPVSLSNLIPSKTHDEEEEDELSSLHARVPASPFSGPNHFLPFSAQCFTFQKANFEYKLCPFQNVTQRETSHTFGRKKFSGIIGVWYEWIVEDGNLAGWRMLNGDFCGDEKPRFTTVHFACGTVASISDVFEPEQCHYKMTFKIPQSCHPDSLLIYPILSEDLQHLWDILEFEKQNNELTDKGYNKRLNEIFIKAGLMQLEKAVDSMPLIQTKLTDNPSSTSLKNNTSPLQTAAGNETEMVNRWENQVIFDGLERCQMAYDDLVLRLNQSHVTSATTTTTTT